MLVSCCVVSEVPYAVNSNLDLCLKCEFTLIMWLILGSVSSSSVTTVSLSDADSSVNTIKQKLLASLKVCNSISATSIAVTVAVLHWIQFLCLLICISGLVLAKCETLPGGGAATSWSRPGPFSRWGHQGTMYQYDYLWLTLRGPSKIYLKREWGTLKMWV